MIPKDKQKQFDDWGFYIVEKNSDSKMIRTLAMTLYLEYYLESKGRRFIPFGNIINGTRYKMFINSNLEN